LQKRLPYQKKQLQKTHSKKRSGKTAKRHGSKLLTFKLAAKFVQIHKLQICSQIETQKNDNFKTVIVCSLY
jgi:hypothetical protein